MDERFRLPPNLKDDFLREGFYEVASDLYELLVRAGGMVLPADAILFEKAADSQFLCIFVVGGTAIVKTSLYNETYYSFPLSPCRTLRLREQP